MHLRVHLETEISSTLFCFFMLHQGEQTEEKIYVCTTESDLTGIEVEHNRIDLINLEVRQSFFYRVA